MPELDIRKDMGTDAKIRIEMRRDFFNLMVEHGAKVADWEQAFHEGRAKATGVDQYLQADPARRREAAGARAAAEGQRLSTPREDGLRMPAEWAPHERTLMAWPARAELWGAQLAQAKSDYAATATAVAAFEPLTMVCANEAAAAEARAALPGEVDVVVEPIDDSWLRDSGPIFVTGDDGRRCGVHFGFNAWGEKFQPYDRDAAIGGSARRARGRPVLPARRSSSRAARSASTARAR